MKYMGSKSRIVKDILPVMLNNYNGNVFVDLFCGGCSVIENVPNSYRRIANDSQYYLIEMWKALVNDEKFPHTIDREFYKNVRASYNTNNGNYSDALIGWVGFMASFNGRFFDGGYSGHNVVGKNGKARDYIRENINNTLSQVPALRGVEFHSVSYANFAVPDGSLVYCDPPYKGTKQYSSSKNFDYDKFYEWCRQTAKNGNKVFVSEYAMPDDFACVWSKGITNAMHQTNTKKPVEKLFLLEC